MLTAVMQIDIAQPTRPAIGSRKKKLEKARRSIGINQAGTADSERHDYQEDSKTSLNYGEAVGGAGHLNSTTRCKPEMHEQPKSSDHFGNMKTTEGRQERDRTLNSLPVMEQLNDGTWERRAR